MPTYSYACKECDHRFDIQQSFSDASLTECPQCRGSLRKLFNAVGVVFKGSGFYRTDSRSSSSSDSGSSSSSSSNGQSNGSAASTSSEKASSGSEKKSSPAAASTGSSDGSAA